MNYNDLVDQLGYYLQQYGSLANPEFTAAIPNFIQNAELRIYRELDPLATRSQKVVGQLTPYSRTISFENMPSPTIGGYPVWPNYPIVVQGVSAIVPVPGLNPQNGVRVRFERVSLDFIDMAWPTETVYAPPGQPCAYYAMVDHRTAVIAPTPDQAYTVEITGTWRPAPMSPTNPNTYLGDFMWDLFFAAVMVEAAGWERNFGSQGDDPKLALSWEARYQSNLKNALEEEQRRKAQDPGWEPFQPTPYSGSPRP